LLIAWLATHLHSGAGAPDYAKAMALVAAVTFLAVIGLALLGFAVRPEARENALGRA
jgi:hypothetical protein